MRTINQGIRTINQDMLTEEKEIEISVYSDIGGRTEQQDCAYVGKKSGEVLAAVCDGMGGLQEGRLASRTAIHWLQNQYLQKSDGETFSDFFQRMLEETDEQVFFLKDDYRRKLRAGTTLVAVGIKEKRLYWLSVGDSRLYIQRGTEFVQVTRDHNYFLELNEWYAAGKITQEQYLREKKKGEALISYIGMGGVELFDLGRKPLRLQEGDILLLTTDGLWKAASGMKIQEILGRRETLERKTMALAALAKETPKETQDNATFILLQISGEKNGGQRP